MKNVEPQCLTDNNSLYEKTIGNFTRTTQLTYDFKIIYLAEYKQNPIASINERLFYKK